MNPLLLETLARLETAGGDKTIKGPNGEDSNNLFNIKDFSGSGFRAVDKAEGSNDKYRTYATREDSKRDATDMIRRLYPQAAEATTGEEFADGLLNGVGGRKYATDPAYREKIISTYNSLAKGTAVGRQAAPAAVLPAVARASLVDRQPATQTPEPSLLDRWRKADSTLIEDPRAMQYGLLDALLGRNSEEPDDPNWAITPDLTKGLSLKEEEYLREAESGGKAMTLRRLSEITENRGRDRTLGEQGAIPTIAASLTSTRGNPVAMGTMLFTAGVGTIAGGALRAQAAGQAAGVAQRANLVQRAALAVSPAQRLAAAGRPGAAVAAAVGEGAAVDLALTGLDDTVGRQVYTPGEYAANVAVGAAIGALPDLAMLPGHIREARARHMAESTPSNMREITADVALNEQRAARELADDTAREAHTVTTDKDASIANAGELPEAVGARTSDTGSTSRGGDQDLGKILWDWSGADESVGLRKVTGSPTAESFPVLDLTELDANIPSSRLFPEFGKDVDPVWATLNQNARIRAAREDKPWKDLIKKTGYEGDYDTLQKLPPGLYPNKAALDTPHMAPTISALTSIAKEMLPGSRITLGVQSADLKASIGSASPGGLVLSAGKSHFIGINGSKDTAGALYTGVHEIGHVVLHEHLSGAHPGLLSRMVGEHQEFLIEYKAGSAAARYKRFSAGGGSIIDPETGGIRGRLPEDPGSAKYIANFDEYGAEAFVRFVERQTKAANPRITFDKGVVDTIKQVWDKLKRLFDIAMARGYLPKDSAFDEFFQSVLDGANAAQARSSTGTAGDAASYSMTSAQARKFSDEVNAAAVEALRVNPIDTRKLDVLAALAPERMGALTTGLVLAKSKTPVLQRMAQLITETTTGAAGRKATVAVRRDSVATMLYGDSAQAYTNIAERWATSEGHSIRDRWFSGDSRREFDRQVYLYKRQLEANPSVEPTAHPLVKKASEQLHALYQRSADMKRSAGTIGSALLPKSSVSYVPQQLDGKRLAKASVEEQTAIKAALVQNWVSKNEWSKGFSEGLAQLYIDRAAAKPFGDSAYGGKMVDSTGVGDVRTVTREAVEAGYITEADAADAMARLQKNSSRGGGDTRSRLDIPMSAPLPGGKTMMDFFVTDQLALAHRHVQNAAGEISLTEMGIPGRAGLDRMRLAAMASTPKPTLAEMRAFDQVAAELFGESPKGAVHSELAQTVRLATSVLRLGGAAFNQLAETTNLIHSLGISAAFRQIVTLPGYMLEVRRRANGEFVKPGLLDSVEAWGGEIGMQDYRINFPLRATDEALREYSEAPGLFSALAKAGAMAQHKISFFRGINAAQHRSTAEEILKRASRMVRDWDGTGSIPKPMQDMGFDSGVVQKFKDNFDKVAVYDAAGRLQEFDVTGVNDTAAAEAFVQAVHRGTKQLIQGTLIGERNAWVHNDYIGLLTQFRTFSITAMEKQWARNRFMHDNQYVGYAYLGGLIAMQSALAYPIYLARVQSQAMLIQDEEKRKKFLDSRLNLPAVTRGLMNYAGASGLTGDMLEYAMMFGGKTAGLEGARGAGQADLASSLIPAVGALNQTSRSLGGAAEAALDDKDGNVNVERVLKTLPFSTLWYVVPFINMAKE
jgi:hypothetical protein